MKNNLKSHNINKYVTKFVENNSKNICESSFFS